MGRRRRGRGAAKADKRRAFSPQPSGKASKETPADLPEELVDQPLPEEDVEPEEVGQPLATLLDAQWEGSRSGAIAGRGYHFQDVIGAWLAARVVSGELAVERIVPEGLEDMSCEGADAWHVQVKSRQARVGDFPTTKAAGFVVDAWRRHRERSALQPEAKLAVVFERPIAGTSLRGWGQPLAETLASHDGLRAALAKAAAAQGLHGDLPRMLESVCVMVLSWAGSEAETSSMLARHLRLPVGAALPLVLALRAEVARCADANAATNWSTRVGLTRTDLGQRVDEVAALIDQQSLLQAIRDGACEAVDFTTALEERSFYEGVGVQPGHIAAGLTVPRPEVVDRVLAGLDRTGACLVTGPSGAGKSAVTWMAAYVARHILWYRVRRLREQDVALLLRLAAEVGAGPSTPVGFVVDGVGTGTLQAWDALRRETATRAGVLLLGSVRTEDMFPLATLADCAVVQPRLDEDLASRIHGELARRSATAASHWLEAYEQSDGLTLEYTYLLTRGRRLRDVLAEQVRTRVREGRDIELMVLGVVATAHRWGATVPVDRLATVLGISDSDLSRALRRLIEEHLLHREGDRLAGLHPLRSAVLADEAHAVPRPTMTDTTRRLVQLLPPEDLRPFLAGLLIDRDDLDALVVKELARRISRVVDELHVLVAALQGLRLADFARTARGWVQLLDRHGVLPAMQPITLNLALIDSPLVEAMDERLLAAVGEIRRTERDACPMRDELVATVGADSVRESLARCSTSSAVTRLLAPLAGSRIPPDPETMTSAAPLAATLHDASIDDLSTVLSTAREVSVALAEHLVRLAGGQDAMLRRVFTQHAWLIELEVVEQDGQTMPRARILSANGASSRDAAEDVRDLARLLLGCIPAADKADVAAVLAGGRLMQVGDYTHATSGLLRRYAHGQTAIAWNRARLRIAIAMVAEADATRRLDAGRRLLADATQFLKELATGWVRARLARDDRERLARLQQRLGDEIEQLRPPPARTVPGAEDVTEEGNLEIDDVLHTVLQGIVGNVPSRLVDPEPNYHSLAAFLGNTLGDQLRRVETLDWRLLGLSYAPDPLTMLGELFRDLHAVIAELASGDTPQESLIHTARSVSRRAALHQAAEFARQRATHRLEIRVIDLRQRCTGSGLDAEIVVREEPSDTVDALVWPPHSLAVLVRLSNLTEWSDALIRLAEILATLPPEEPPVTVVPIRSGRIVPAFTVRYISQMWPDPDAAKGWAGLLPAPHATPLADATIKAHHALRTLSAIAELAGVRDLQPAVEAEAERAIGRFQHARQVVADRGGDPVVDEILATLEMLAERVQDELDAGPDIDREGLAASIAAGLDQPNDDFNMLLGLSVIAHEWDIDPEGARQFLLD